MMEIAPVTLSGRFVRLEPLQMKHASDLFTAAQDSAIWTYMSAHLNGSLPAIEAWISAALQEQAAGMVLPFAIIDLASGYAVGSTRYMTIAVRDRGLEIGWTWLSPQVQRTGVNTECKYLLLRHAFETLGVIRVQLKTHHDNVRSQRAIERIGATREGVLRNHMIMPDGSYRHSVYYSIIESEWPRVKGRLEAKMQ
jgi:N-acetyltransferase